MKNLFSLVMILIVSSCGGPSNLESAEEAGEDVSQETEEGNVQSEWVNFGDGHRGYLVRPGQEGQFPAAVMIHEWWGLNENIQEMARDLAGEGYVVLAVDLYNGNVASTPQEAGQYATQVRENVPEAVEHMKSATSFLRESDFVLENAIASIGWCFGGGMSLQLSLNESLAATVIYYGDLETNEERLSAIKWPVLGIFADQDAVISLDSVHQFEAGLNQLGIENEIHIYEGVPHAFANPSNPGHDPEKTADAWEKTIAFLDRNLKQAGS
jgi:carboxymethylenebutenolidase